MMIECIRFKSHQKGYLQGFADIYVDKWGIEIPGFTLWMKEGRRWVNPPGVEYEDKEGQKKHRAFFYFRNKEHWVAFQEEVKKAIDKWCAENQEAPQPCNDSASFDDSECPF